jgi:hypothetical protein
MRMRMGSNTTMKTHLQWNIPYAYTSVRNTPENFRGEASTKTISRKRISSKLSRPYTKLFISDPVTLRDFLCLE